MPLLFCEIIHLSLSLVVFFIVWRIWKKPAPAFLAAITTGFLVDVDHWFDYFLAFGFNINLEAFFQGYQFLATDRIYLPFHGWEYVPILLSFVFILKSKLAKTIFLAASLSLFLHLSFDSASNEGLRGAQFYSITYRAMNNFELEKMATKEHYEKHLELKKRVDFGLEQLEVKK